MTNQPDEVLQEPAVGQTEAAGAQNIVFGGGAANNKIDDIEVPDVGSDPIVKDRANKTPSIELVEDDNEAPKALPEELPEWYSALDEVSRCEVRHLCEEAGPLSDPEVLSQLQNRYCIDENEAANIVELFHEGKLQGRRTRLKSILKTRDEDDGPPLRKQLSWSDENGGNLTQKHEMDSWHYMYSHRNSPAQCCLIL